MEGAVAEHGAEDVGATSVEGGCRGDVGRPVAVDSACRTRCDTISIMSLVVPTIETDRLLLRPFRASDGEPLFALQSDAEAMRYWDSPP